MGPTTIITTAGTLPSKSYTPSFHTYIDILISTIQQIRSHNHHGEQHSILLLATDRSACAVKIKQPSPTSDTIHRIFAMRHNTRVSASTRFWRLFLGESGQSTRSSGQGRLVAHHTPRRNPFKSVAIFSRNKD